MTFKQQPIFTPLEIKNRLMGYYNALKSKRRPYSNIKASLWSPKGDLSLTGLTKALAISALLHLLLFTMVSVIVEPTLKLTHSPSVSFLGSILNRESVSPVKETHHRFRIKPARVNPATPPFLLYRETAKQERAGSYRVKIAVFKIKRTSLDKKFPINPVRTPPFPTAKQYYKVRKSGANGVKPETIFHKPKQQPKYSGRKIAFVYLRARKQSKGVANIFWNPPYQRDILHQPPLPEYHLWTDRTESDFHLEFEFLVSPQGRVIAVKKLTSSGLPEIDAQAMRYLKKWQFVPSPREQWGRIRLNFKLR